MAYRQFITGGGFLSIALLGVAPGMYAIHPASADSVVAPVDAPEPPPLRFKKEDFVPIPDMAPIPLDTPEAGGEPPLQVTIPNIKEVEHQPEPPPKNLFERLIAGLFFWEGDEPPPAAEAQEGKDPASPLAVHSPGVVIKKETLHLSSDPAAMMPPPGPLGALAPAAGQSADDTGVPPIALSDLPPPAKPLESSPPVPAPLLASAPLRTLPPGVPANAVRRWAEEAAPPLAVVSVPPVFGGEAPAIPVSPLPWAAALPPALSEESRQVVQALSALEIGKPAPPARPVSVTRARDLTAMHQKPAEGAVTHEARGIKIEIKPPRLNFDYELEKAYNALVAGDAETAVGIYKTILDNDAGNKHALFGLATAYHRAGQVTLARPFYARLLAADPSHTDGLNNFLVLLSDESPAEALAELERLAQRHPQYSALPAQMAVIYQRLGMPERAESSMLRALDMAPENLTYRYNLAILLDKQGKHKEAAAMYRQLIQASQRGQVIPGKVEKIQQRLTFISSNRS